MGRGQPYAVVSHWLSWCWRPVQDSLHPCRLLKYVNFSSWERLQSPVLSDLSSVCPIDSGSWTWQLSELACLTAAMPPDIEPKATLAGTHIRFFLLGLPCLGRYNLRNPSCGVKQFARWWLSRLYLNNPRCAAYSFLGRKAGVSSGSWALLLLCLIEDIISPSWFFKICHPNPLIPQKVLSSNVLSLQFSNLASSGHLTPNTYERERSWKL